MKNTSPAHTSVVPIEVVEEPSVPPTMQSVLLESTPPRAASLRKHKKKASLDSDIIVDCDTPLLQKGDGTPDQQNQLNYY